ncbi:hypothetical protein DRQ17_00665 [bacterium]|nr:MAG: hypothetical protein DRQ17_00665 [bacterium]
MKKRKIVLSIFLSLVAVFIILGLLLSPAYVIGAAILLPIYALIIEYGRIVETDEWEKSVNHKAGFYSLIFTIFLQIGVFLKRFFETGNNPEPVYYLLIIFPVVLYYLIVLFQGVFSVKNARMILYVFGGIWILFALLSEGFTIGGLMQSLFGIGFLIVAGVSYGSTIISAFLSFLYAVFLIVFVIVNSKNPENLLILFLTMGLPLIISGTLLLKTEKGGE